jgi:hypothetical protein
LILLSLVVQTSQGDFIINSDQEAAEKRPRKAGEAALKDTGQIVKDSPDALLLRLCGSQAVPGAARNRRSEQTRGQTSFSERSDEHFIFYSIPSETIVICIIRRGEKTVICPNFAERLFYHTSTKP